MIKKRIVRIGKDKVAFNTDDLSFKKYRKKPVVIQAIQIGTKFEVDTLEGTMKGNAKDFLIIGVKGEMYPCDSEIFKETYNKVCEECGK